jgi:4-hydroxythreonine-4-phosphate dehydrogenase
LSDNLGWLLTEFIFMLTRDDRTIADAREVYGSVAQTGIRHVGCKDLGLPRDELAGLMEDIRANGHTSYLEVVSETDEATLESARIASEIGPDYLIGGTLIEPVQEIIAGSPVRFFPYVGKVVVIRACCAGRSRRLRKTPGAPRSSAWTGSTFSPTATTETSKLSLRRW